MLMLYLKRLTRFFSLRLRVLHLSPHPGLRARFAAMRNLQYVTADLADRTVDVRVDITDLPFPDGAFDLIFCSHVLEHVEDDRRALSELFRVTHPNGVALIQVPIDRYRAATLEDPAIVTPQDREKYYWQFDHLRLYGPDFADRMRGAGFTVAVVESVEVAPAHQRRRFGIDRPEELLHVGHKASPAAVSAPPYGGRRRPILRRACAS
jgi:SAM-dependent methyltransferase